MTPTRKQRSLSGLMCLICAIALGVWLHNASPRVAGSLNDRQLGATTKVIEFGAPFSSEHILISNFTEYIDDFWIAVADCPFVREGFFHWDKSRVRNTARRHYRHGTVFINLGPDSVWRQGEGIRSDSCPLPNIIGGSLAKILNFYTPYRKGGVFKVHEYFGNIQIGSQLSLSGATTRAYLPNKGYELQSSNNSQNGREIGNPFVRRFWLFACGYLGGFLLCLRGSIWIQDWRSNWYGRLGWLFVCLGGLSAITGTGLFLLNRYPSTWNWPL